MIPRNQNSDSKCFVIGLNPISNVHSVDDFILYQFYIVWIAS